MSTTLQEAHARIRSLEDQLRVARAHRRVEQPGRARRVATGLAFLAFVAVITVWAGHRIAEVNAPAIPSTSSPRPIPSSDSSSQPGAGDLSFQCLGDHDNPYPFGPSFVDLDGDRVREIVSLAWWTHHDQAALYVVAFDRKTHAVRWRSPGHVARCGVDMASRLFVDPADRIVVRDDTDMVHRLDARTGQHVVSTLARDEHRKPQVTGAFDHRLPIVDTTPGDRETLARAAMRKLEAGGPVPSMSLSIHDLVDGTRRVTIANGRVNELESRDVAFGFDERGAIQWQTPLTSSEERPMVDPPRAINTWTMVCAAKLAHLYQRASGVYAIAVRDAKTGGLRHDAPLTVGGVRVDAGAPIGGVTCDEAEVFFYLGDALVVFDLETLMSRAIRAF